MAEILPLKEAWRPIKGTPYEVSDCGRVRRDGRLLKLNQTNKGYLRAALSVGNAVEHRLVHRLVVEAFLGPIPDGLCVNHKDANRTNNHVSNLEIVTRLENQRHMIKLGRNVWRTHCLRGHPFTADNVKLHKSGFRLCRICDERRHREYGKRRSAALEAERKKAMLLAKADALDHAARRYEADALGLVPVSDTIRFLGKLEKEFRQQADQEASK